MVSRATPIPDIPDISTLKVDPALRSFLSRVKERIEIREGRFNANDKAVTEQGLRYAGFDPAYLNPGTPEYDPGGSVAPEDVPPPPTNITIDNGGGSLSNLITWTDPVGDVSDISHISVWVAINSSDRSSAYELATVDFDEDNPIAKFLHHPLGPGKTYYYWIRSVTYGGVYSTWEPDGAQGGLVAPSYPTIPELLDALASESANYTLQYKVIADSFQVVQPSNTIADYSAGTTYGKDSLVEYSGDYFKSLHDANTGNTPNDPYGIYDEGATYGVGTRVWVDGDTLYESLQAGNTGNTPAISPAWWSDVTASQWWKDITAVVDTDGQAVFEIGTLNSVPTIGIRGDLIVDGSIYANSLHAGEITAEKMVAHDLVTWSLQSGNYEPSGTGVGFLFDADPLSGGYGHIFINNMPTTWNFTGYGGIRVANPTTGDYTELTNSELKFYYNIGTVGSPDMREYRSVRRFEQGVGEHDDVIDLPGYWRKAPYVLVSPATMQTYSPSYPDEKQFTNCNHGGVYEDPLQSMQYHFKIYAKLELESFIQRYTYNSTQLTETNTDQWVGSGNGYAFVEKIIIPQTIVGSTLRFVGDVTCRNTDFTYDSDGQSQIFYKVDDGEWVFLDAVWCNPVHQAPTETKHFNLTFAATRTVHKVEIGLLVYKYRADSVKGTIYGTFYLDYIDVSAPSEDIPAVGTVKWTATETG